MRAEGLETLTGLAGGALFELTAGADWAFARVAREISAHYLLALEPAEADRDGKTHDIRVKVARDGVTLRARQQFAALSPAAATARASAVPAGVAAGPALPLKVGTHRLRGRTPDELKILVVSQTEGIPAAQFALRLLDESGAVVGGTSSDAKGVEGASPRYEEALLVKPGRYTLRAGVADAAGGRQTTRDETVSAELRKAHGLALSDILLFEGVGEKQRLAAPGATNAPTVYAYLELYPLMPGHVFGGTWEVAGPTGAPVVTPATFQADPANRLTAMEGAIDLSALGPGSYVLRARITSHRDPLTTVERSLEIVR
jgi:hypothetical protein